MIITYDDFIWGDKFKLIPNCQFIKTDHVFDYFRSGELTSNKVVTHNSDYAIDSAYESLGDKVQHWFGVNVTTKHPKFTPIPIGLENDYLGKSIEKKRLIADYGTRYIPDTKLLYINYNIGTNPVERRVPYEMFTTNDNVTVRTKMLPQDEYYKEIKEHSFMISPPGNGLDCHRTWETLYLGRIPILKRMGRLEELYRDLPVLFIDNYSDITIDFLLRKKAEFKVTPFCLDKLYFSYWEQLIAES